MVETSTKNTRVLQGPPQQKPEIKVTYMEAGVCGGIYLVDMVS